MKPYIKKQSVCIAVITLRYIKNGVITLRNIKSAVITLRNIKSAD